MSSVKRRLAGAVLRVIGWKPAGERPGSERVVVIAAPHTSNWDFPLLIAFAWWFELSIGWMGKHSLFRGPFGPIMRALGGIPVRRDRRANLVTELAKALVEGPPRALVIPAEGSRSRCEHWKSGFYHVAREADVPVVLSFLDYGRRRGGFGPSIELTGQITPDMDRVRAFYAGIQARYPEDFGPIRLDGEEIE